ncbi:outer membrane beta-barrel protein [Paradevosia shaoguanensis]|uniref:outer membrane beta-barrel protein n=1 Tax=Paradevosia shaoguanensis TaxID=1335043 RepID=UPI0019330CF4|nr:outer membrane beta-barrel protein [Paradevosia shaoguanensis]
MKKILVSVIGALATMSCGAAVAADFGGTVTAASIDPLPWYVSGKAGIALPGTININATGFGGAITGKSTFDPGFAGAVAIGKYITPEVRAELELGLAQNAGKSFDGNLGLLGPVSGALSGNVTTTTLMAMGYYEFTQFGNFVPYLSAGVGVANVNSDLTFTDAAPGGSSGTITGSSTVIAGRVGAGFQFKVADSIDITADYTAMLGNNANFTFNSAFGGFPTNITSSVMGHALAAGIKGRF